jgi:hypothetical protein
VSAGITVGWSLSLIAYLFGLHSIFA